MAYREKPKENNATEFRAFGFRVGLEGDEPHNEVIVRVPELLVRDEGQARNFARAEAQRFIDGRNENLNKKIKITNIELIE